MANDFVHLHVHSEYSMLDGLGRIKELVKEAKRLGQPALALTDHGVMHGAIEFFRACKENEIKPIVGIEAYQTVWGRPMGGRDGQLDRENYHILLLAKNMTGYRNLLKIASHSQLHGYYYKPRVDHDFLAKHAEGIICTTGCLGAEVPQLLMHGKDQEAYDRFGWYVDVFGKENFYIELQEHSIPELIPVNKSLVPWSEKFGIGLLATNDVHYVKEADADPHEMLLCVQTGESIKSEKRMRLSDQSYFLKSREQMEATFRPYIDLPDSAYENSLRIAEMCDVDLEDKNYHLPDMPIPEGFTYDTYLRHLTEEGLTRLYGERATNEEIQKRKEFELGVIAKMGFSIYFLIVGDLCRFAKSQNIWWNVRGSGAGSLVAYCIGITGLDPLKNSLIFERFLNPARVTMPDFDLDFPDDQREEMIRYTIEKYGREQVAQIVTFGRMKARAAIKDVGRAQEIPLNQVNRISQMIPAIPGKPVLIKEVMTEGHEFYNPELVELYKNEPWVTSLLDYSMKLEGVTRHSGIHAAAVIVADKELVHYAPLMRPSKGSVTETVAQFEFPILESIGLLKVDFLGLSTLSVMREAGRLIKERHGIEYTLANIPFEGEVTEQAFKLLSSGEVSGVFQVESAGMRRVLTEMRPHMFEHIIATISLYRPGPLEYIPNFIRRLHGEEKVEFKHPTLEPILGETLGICVSGDALVSDARTGQRCRLDEVDQLDEFYIQGVDAQWQPAIGRVTHWIDSGIKPVYRMTLRNGAEIKVTTDHRLLTEQGWQPLSSLQIGDYVATPHRLFGPTSEEKQEIDRRKLRVLAYLIADGSLASMASVDFVSKDPAMLAEYQQCLTVFEDVRPVLTPQVRDVTRVGVAKDEALDLPYHTPTSLLTWLRQLGLKHPAGSRPGGLRSHEKFIPPFVFQLGEDDIAFFLASLWDCDGYMGNRLCHYKTISKQLAGDIQTLLLRLGIRSTIYISEYTNARPGTDEGIQRQGYQITVYDTARLANLLQPFMSSPKKGVICTGQSSTTVERLPFIAEVDGKIGVPYKALMRDYGIDRQHFYAKAKASRSRISAHVIQPLIKAFPLAETEQRLGVAWEEIVAIDFVGDEHVYDLTVEGLHSFVANNIVVHNCIYQEQIIQILNKLAGYTAGEADLVRRAISKKKASDIEKHKKIFVEGCAKNNIPKDAAEAIYGDIEFFARYGFNKCLPGDVEVIDTATGRMVKIEDLYTGKATIGGTLACDTTLLKLQAGTVAAVMDNGVKPVYRLTTALGRTIEATANHPFYTFNGWRLLEELTIGEQLAVPRQIPVEGKKEWAKDKIIAFASLLTEGVDELPAEIFELSNRQLELLLRSLWDFRAQSFGIINSARLARQLQHIMLRLGLVARIQLAGAEQCIITIEEEQQIAVEKVPTVFHGFGTLSDYATTNILVIDRASTYHETSDIYWDKIVSIEYIGEKQTYDLEVPGLHNFIANDILVHNSHAADYAVITVQTAYLKAHYPVEYMAALLLIERDKTEKVVNFINECRRMGVSVLPPDVNYSGLDFDIQDIPPGMEAIKPDPMLAFKFPVPPGSAIRFGMAAVKMVGEGPVQVILDARKEGGPFKSLEEFADRVDLRKVGKRPLECLIKVGAFDRFGKRSQLLAVIDQMVGNSASVHDARASGQLSMFDLMGGSSSASVSPIRLPDIEEVKGREKLTWEKELLGVYAASHPMQSLGIDMSKIVTCFCNELSEEHNGKNVTLAGMITTVRTINTKKGDQMAFVQLEDRQGQCEVVVFPRTYAEVKEKLVPDTLVIMKGKAQTREGQTSLLVDSIQNYVDQAVAVGGEEPTQYQRPLMDVTPTFNGMVINEANADYVDGLTDSFVTSEEDDFGAASEENPFRNELPSWLGGTVPQPAAAALPVNQPPAAAVPPASVPATAEKAVTKATPTEKSAPAVELAAKPVTATPPPAQPLSTTVPAAGPAPENKRISITSSLTAALNQTTNGHDHLHSNGNGHDADPHKAPEPSTVAPAKAVETRTPTPDAQATADASEPKAPASHGNHNHAKVFANGGSNGSVNGGHRNARQPDSQTPRAHERHLQITFRRSGNLERDKYRLKEIYDHVRDPRGRDRFFIVLETNGQRCELAFPNDPCSISDRLLGELTKHFRVDVVVAEEESK